MDEAQWYLDSMNGVPQSPVLVTGEYDLHFNEWAQTCELDKWVWYNGPNFKAWVRMVVRPKLITKED